MFFVVFEIIVFKTFMLEVLFLIKIGFRHNIFPWKQHWWEHYQCDTQFTKFFSLYFFPRSSSLSRLYCSYCQWHLCITYISQTYCKSTLACLLCSGQTLCRRWCRSWFAYWGRSGHWSSWHGSSRISFHHIFCWKSCETSMLQVMNYQPNTQCWI